MLEEITPEKANEEMKKNDQEPYGFPDGIFWYNKDGEGFIVTEWGRCFKGGVWEAMRFVHRSYILQRISFYTGAIEQAMEEWPEETLLEEPN